MARKRKGTKIVGGFIALPNIMYDNVAWKSLTTNARCILLEFMRRYNGSNNGFITMSCREAAAVFHGSKSTAQKRLLELQEHGFIKIVNKGVYQNRHASTWLLTFQTDDRNNQRPTNNWKHYSPPKKTTVLQAVQKSTQKRTSSYFSVANSTTGGTVHAIYG